MVDGRNRVPDRGVTADAPPDPTPRPGAPVPQRRHARVVVAAEGDREPSTGRHYALERGDQPPSDAPSAMGTGHDQGMQLPHSTVILGQSTDPPQEHVAGERPSGEALPEDAADLVPRRGHVRPPAGGLEALDEEERGLFADAVRLGYKVDDLHGDLRGSSDRPSKPSTSTPVIYSKWSRVAPQIAPYAPPPRAPSSPRERNSAQCPGTDVSASDIRWCRRGPARSRAGADSIRGGRNGVISVATAGCDPGRRCASQNPIGGGVNEGP